MKLFIALAFCVVAALALPSQEKIVNVRPRVSANPDYVPKQGKIVGGQEADHSATSHQFPHAVHLHYNGSPFGFYCTAQIVHESWIMTAAHCCDNNVPGNYYLMIGGHNRNENQANQDYDPYRYQQKGVKAVWQDEEYNSAFIRNDICLLELEDPMTFVKDMIQPALLATDETSIADIVGSEVIPCGWGLTSDSTSQIPDVLMWTTDYTMSDADCSSIFGIEYDAGEICIDTEDTHQGTCSGDSGGPLNLPNPAFDANFNPTTQEELADPRAIRWITNGITSYGASAGCEAGYPDAFTDVNFYNGGTSAGKQGPNWIRDTTGGALPGQ